MVGDGACCTLRRDICAGLYGYTLGGCTTGYNLGACAAVQAIKFGNVV